MTIGVFSHTHIQETPSTVWEIYHNLGTFAPVIDVLVQHKGETHKILPQGVIVVDNRTVRVTFSVPRTGTAAIR